jgi:heptosyltransferase II
MGSVHYLTFANESSNVSALPPNPNRVTQRPLVVRLRNYIGDVVLTLPALARLRSAGYELHVLGKPWLKSLLEAYPDEITTYPKAFSERRATLKALKARLMQRDPTFSTRVNAITFPTSFSSALDMRAAGLRAFGFAAEARSLLLVKSAKIVYGEHALDSYWRLTNAFLSDDTPPPPAANYLISEASEREAEQIIAQAGVRAGYIVLVPFAGGTFEKLDKKWAGFPELAARLAASGRDLVLAPGPAELEDAKAHFPGAILLPNVGLSPYAAIMRNAALTIANDTGPGHMVASVGGQLLSVLGPTKVEQWGARGARVMVVQSYPTWPSVEAVLAAANRLL